MLDEGRRRGARQGVGTVINSRGAPADPDHPRGGAGIFPRLRGFGVGNLCLRVGYPPGWRSAQQLDKSKRYIGVAPRAIVISIVADQALPFSDSREIT